MNDEEIKVLKETFKAGPLYWRFDASEAPKRVARIGGPPPAEEGDVEEPSLCAYLDGGGYVALWNAEPAQFVTMKAIDYQLPGHQSKDEPVEMYVVYSPNESAASDGAGFWNNKDGWTTFAGATKFSAQEKAEFNLPIATGQDARWVAESEAEASYGEFERDRVVVESHSAAPGQA